MPATRPIVITLLVGALGLLRASAAPDEDAFIPLWSLHRQTPDQHEAVVTACREAAQQRAADGAPRLGRYLPVARTLEGWRLLKLARTNEAVAAFESVLTSQPASDAIARAADTLARRWLSRLDREAVVAALQAYHRENVEFPTDLTAFAPWPPARQPPLRDRLGQPWSYRLASFKRLKTVSRQQYTLFSSAIGAETSALAAALRLPYPAPPIAFVPRNAAAPALVEFRIGAAPAVQTAILQEGDCAANLRFVALDSQTRFVLLCADDFWLAALPGGEGR